MADAIEIATAYVSLVPSLEGSQKKIHDELVPGAEKAGGEAGTTAGKGFGDKFTSVTSSGAFQKGLAGGMAVAGLAVVGSFSSAIESMDAGAMVAAQLDLTKDQSAAQGEAAGNLYAGAYGESLTDVNTAVGAVMSSMSGMKDASAADLEDITSKALNLATAFEVDVAESTNTAGILMNTGLAANADQAMDLITASMQKVPASVRGEILPIMDEYSKHFAGLGIDGETAMGMIVAASSNGAIGMDKMGDALKEFTIRATDMSTSTADAYTALGLSSADMRAGLLAGGDSANAAMGDIVHALQTVEDPAEQAALSLALFGTPLEDLGTDQIPNFLGMIDPMGDSFASTAGAADEFGATLNSGPGVALEELRRTVETTFMGIAEKALPVLTDLAGWVQDNQWVLVALGAAIGVGLVLAFTAWAASVWAANAALLANPVTWIIVGILALVAAIVALAMNWDAVVAWVSEVWGGFMNWLREIGDGFVVWWNGLWAGVGAWISSVWTGFTTWVSGIWSGFVGLLQAAGDGFSAWWSGLWSGIGSFISGVWSGFVAFVVGVWEGYIGLIQAGLTAFSAFWAAVWDGVAAFIAGVWSGIVSVATGAWDGLVSFVTGIPGRFLAGLAALGGLAGSMLGWVGNAARAVMDKFGELVGEVGSIPGRILGALGDVGSMLYNAGADIVRGLMNGIKSLAGTIGSFFLDLLPGWIVGPFKTALGIHSPSRVFAGFGENIGEGVLVGVSRMQDDIDKSMAALVTVPDLPSITGSTGVSRPPELVAAGLAAAYGLNESAADPGAGRGWHIENLNTGANAGEIFDELDWRERTAAL